MVHRTAHVPARVAATLHLGELERHNVEIAATGGLAEACSAATATLLALVGLTGIAARVTAPLACFALGAALLFEGAAITARHAHEMHAMQREGGESLIIGGGIASEAIAGAIGTVLALLALVGVAPVSLVSLAILLYGVSVLASSFASSRLDAMQLTAPESNAVMSDAARRAEYLAAGGHVMVGLAATVLGFLALVDIAPWTLGFVAMLCLGVSIALSGTAMGVKMLRTMNLA